LNRNIRVSFPLLAPKTELFQQARQEIEVLFCLRMRSEMDPFDHYGGRRCTAGDFSLAQSRICHAK
jgi:hypothetical protein